MKIGNLSKTRKQSEFCLELVKRLNEDVQTSKFEGRYYIDNYSQMQGDIVRIRRELMKLSKMLGEEYREV